MGFPIDIVCHANLFSYVVLHLLFLHRVCFVMPCVVDDDSQEIARKTITNLLTKRKYVHSFPSLKALKVVLVSVSLARHQLTLQDHGANALHMVCLFTPQILLVFMVPTHGGMARLSWPGTNRWSWYMRWVDQLCEWVSVVDRVSVFVNVCRKSASRAVKWRSSPTV